MRQNDPGPDRPTKPLMATTTKGYTHGVYRRSDMAWSARTPAKGDLFQGSTAHNSHPKLAVSEFIVCFVLVLDKFAFGGFKFKPTPVESKDY